MKRLLYSLAVLAAIGIIVGAFFFLRYRSEPAPQQPEAVAPSLPLAPDAPAESVPAVESELPSNESAPAEPVALGAGLRTLSSRPVLAFAVRADGNVLLTGPDGTVSELRGTTATTLSPTAVVNLQTAAFSFDASKLLAVFGERNAPQVALFDVKSKTWQPFSAPATDAAWAPNDLRVAYLSPKAGWTTLNTLDIGDAKAKPQELARVRFADAALAWHAPDQILLRERASGFVPSSAWVWDIKKKTLSLFAEDQRGFDVRWPRGAPSGLVFVAGRAGRGGSLLLVSPQGDVRETFSFLSFPEKCAFASEPLPEELRRATSTPATPLVTTLICAVPRDAETLEASILPDTYRKRAVFTVDDFYRINLATGAIQTVSVDSPQPLDATNAAVSGDALYFINRYDQKLYSLQVK